MTASSTIATAWRAAIWESATVKAITPRIFSNPVSELSERELQECYHNRVINFFEYTIMRASEILLSQQTKYTFTATVRYTLDAGLRGSNYNTVRNALETVDDLVISDLGTTWGSTIDFYIPQSEPPTFEQLVISGDPCWRGSLVYRGIKTV